MRLLRETASTLGEAFHCAFRDNCFILARAAAYSSALSLFPGLIFAAALFFTGNGASPRELPHAVGQVFPPGVRRLVMDYLTLSPARSTRFLLIAALAAVIFAADLIGSLMEGFRAAYRASRRQPVWKDYLVAVSLVFISILPLTAANGALIFAEQIEEGLTRWLGERWWLADVFRIVWWIVALATMTVIIAVLYYLAPNRRQRLADVLPGAVLTALLWASSTALFAFYVQNIASYRDLYGSVSAVIVLLIWMYLASAIVLLGCEYNAARERRLGLLPPRPPSHH